MKKSRIKKHHFDYNYCQIDGDICIHCSKCDHIPVKRSTNRLHPLLIFLLIVCIIIFILNPLIQVGIDKNFENNNDSNTLENKVDEYNNGMSADERQYREWTGIGEESVSDNYNSMG